jgi:hypothetical protein
MPDFSLEPQNTLVVGMTGSGKTTFVIKLLLNSNPACTFIFDDENRTAPRLKINAITTDHGFESALARRWVVFNPATMFVPQDGDRDLFATKRRAFRWFCTKVYEVCQRGPGQKIISIPEIWRFCTPDSIPMEFARLMQMGRELNTHVICDTQHPERVNESVLGASTELVCFKLLGPRSDALATIAKLGADGSKIGSVDFPKGSFIAYNRLTGGQLAGKMF